MKTWHFGDKVGNDFDFAANTFKFGGQPIITDSLLAWWKHEEGTGTILGDSHGSFDGTVGGTLTNFWDNTTLDGTPVGTYDASTNYVNGIGTGLAITGGISITATIYCTNVASGVASMVVSKRNGTTGNWQINRLAGDTDVRFLYHGASGWHLFDTTDFSMANNTWYILTFIYTFGTGSTAKMYRDLTQCTASWTQLDGDEAPDNTADYVQIGSYDSVGDDSGSGLFWRGRLGDILIYNKVLSFAEITQNFNTLRDRYGL